MIGVAVATLGEYEFTCVGFFLTLLGAVLSSFKGIATHILLVGNLLLHPFDLLRRMSLLAFFQCMIIAHYSGEMDKYFNFLSNMRINEELAEFKMLEKGQWKKVLPVEGQGVASWVYVPPTSVDDSETPPVSGVYKLHAALLMNAVLAFLLNYVSFTANQRTSALSMTVAGCVKQAMSIILSVLLYNYIMTTLNFFGKFVDQHTVYMPHAFE